MRYNATAQLITLERVSDGMGGYLEDTENVVSTFDVTIHELAQELMVSDYGFGSTTDMRVLTDYTGLKRGDLLKIKGQVYKVHRAISYPHISSMVVRKHG